MDWNFGGLESHGCGEENAAFGIIPVPFERTTSYGKGTGAGPAGLVEASRYLELFDEVYAFEPARAGIWTAPPLDFSGETLEENIHLIYTKSAELLRTKKYLIFVGGEHSITFPIVRAYTERFPNLSVLQFDAHADLRYEYEGSIYSHASVMRRVVDLCKVVQVGIRSISIEEFEEIPRLPLTVVYAHEFFRDRAASIDKILENLTENVYITFDLDGFDPSVIPATGTPEPGGFLWQDAMELLEKVFAAKHVVGSDIVELSPVENLPASSFIAAKLVYKMIAMKQVFDKQSLGGK
ncbi:MAG: agmatinase [Acidobacteria bacterium]|nr:agmatinase [Acidobacteriota bacterium]